MPTTLCTSSKRHQSSFTKAKMVSITFQDPTSSTLKLMIKCQHRDIGTPHFHGNLGIIGKDLGKPKSSEQ